MQTAANQYTKLSFSVVLLALVLMCVVPVGCGFQPRGVTTLSFKNLYIQGSTLSISQELKQSFKTNGIQVAENALGAELLLEMLGETNEKRILSLSGTGVVREYELNYRATFRTREPASTTWSAPQTVQTRRDFSYDDKALLGKLDEEAKLNADMRSDAVREIMRRISAIKINTK